MIVEYINEYFMRSKYNFGIKDISTLRIYLTKKLTK